MTIERGVGHIHANFDHRGADQHRPSAPLSNKAITASFCGRHAGMEQADHHRFGAGRVQALRSGMGFGGVA
jgi:hypothetical protein